MRMVIGIARGLKYLHTELDPPFTISEMNSNAVYLTDDFSPKVTPGKLISFSLPQFVILFENFLLQTMVLFSHPVWDVYGQWKIRS